MYQTRKNKAIFCSLKWLIKLAVAELQTKQLRCGTETKQVQSDNLTIARHAITLYSQAS